MYKFTACLYDLGAYYFPENIMQVFYKRESSIYNNFFLNRFSGDLQYPFMGKLILKETSEYVEEIKKSRFVVRAHYVEDDSTAMEILKTVSDPAANHNCWAYITKRSKRCSDDGEPSGTAGRPILSAMEYAGVVNAVVIVTRYFGGIKLGTGGLIRAYSGVTSRCLDNACLTEMISYAVLSVELYFEQTGKFYSILKQNGIEKIFEEYTDRGLVISVKVKESCLENLQKNIENELAGRVGLTVQMPEGKNENSG